MNASPAATADTDAEALVAAIQTRRRIKCERVQEHHTDGGCQNCGTR